MLLWKHNFICCSETDVPKQWWERKDGEVSWCEPSPNHKHHPCDCESSSAFVPQQQPKMLRFVKAKLCELKFTCLLCKFMHQYIKTGLLDAFRNWKVTSTTMTYILVLFFPLFGACRRFHSFHRPFYISSPLKNICLFDAWSWLWGDVKLTTFTPFACVASQTGTAVSVRSVQYTSPVMQAGGGAASCNRY